MRRTLEGREEVLVYNWVMLLGDPKPGGGPRGRVLVVSSEGDNKTADQTREGEKTTVVSRVGNIVHTTMVCSSLCAIAVNVNAF